MATSPPPGMAIWTSKIFTETIEIWKKGPSHSNGLVSFSVAMGLNRYSNQCSVGVLQSSESGKAQWKINGVCRGGFPIGGCGRGGRVAARSPWQPRRGVWVRGPGEKETCVGGDTAFGKNSARGSHDNRAPVVSFSRKRKDAKKISVRACLCQSVLVAMATLCYANMLC